MPPSRGLPRNFHTCNGQFFIFTAFRSSFVNGIISQKPRPAPFYWFASSVDKVLAGPDDYILLPTTPYELLTQYTNNSKDVPIITGTVENEGWMFDACNFLIRKKVLAE